MNERRRFPAACMGVALAALLGAAGAHAARMTRARLEEAYRDALAAQAAGEAAAATEALLALEHEATAGDRRQIERLDAALETVARRLVERAPESLVAVADLHDRVYLEALRRHLPAVAGTSRSAIESVAEELAAGRDPARRQLAAALLARLGGRLQELSEELSAARLYERALDLDAHQATALAGLAAVREKVGDRAAALALLDRLEAVTAADPEARLRRAVLRARLGQREAAIDGLRPLLDAVPDWVASVAAQELGRLLLDAGRPDEALTVVSRAAVRLPCDPVLALQAAYLAERAQPEAPLAPPRLPTAAECAAVESSRVRYNRPPRQAFERLDEALAGRLGGARLALGAALGAGR